MSNNYLSQSQKTDGNFQTLLNNANAARAISQIVEGTIGPKGLDIMMVDEFGDVVISNDGITILKLMEINHPAARMIINTAKAQQTEIGDGTTTATIIAGALVAEGADQVLKGVPVTNIIDGMSKGLSYVLELIQKQTRKIESIDDQLLSAIAAIAGRGHQELADLVIEGARLIGTPRLLNPEYKFADAVTARESAQSQVFKGVLINREPANRQMPFSVEDAKILVIDDALGPEDINNETLKTEAGFAYFLKTKEEYEKNLLKICALGVNLVVIDRGMDDIAEEIFTHEGIMVLERVSAREIENLCLHTGAKKIKRNTLNKDIKVLGKHLGKARSVKVDEKLHNTYIHDGSGDNWATVIIGASTEEVVDELERMAKDAAAAVQAALQEGILPGGGAIEVWLAANLDELAKECEGMDSFGVFCVKEAIIKPFACMAANSGFNQLEKLRNVSAAQRKQEVDYISFHSETGTLIDVVKSGIVDPSLVKKYAIKAAGEVAIAILRINTIIRMREEKNNINSIGDF